MSMPTIRVDDEVISALGEKAQPFVDTPNTVIRRLLKLPEAQRNATPARSEGELMPLIGSGALSPGEKLIWKRRNGSHRAVITEDGRLTVGQRTFNTPSGAAKFVAGYNVNGWTAWRRSGDGCLIGDLREA